MSFIKAHRDGQNIQYLSTYYPVCTRGQAQVLLLPPNFHLFYFNLDMLNVRCYMSKNIVWSFC